MAEARFNATIPERLNEFVNLQIRHGNFSSKSDYLRHVLRKEMDAAQQTQTDYINQVLKRSESSGVCDESPEEIRSGLAKIVKRAVADRQKKNV